ncbi:DNA-directed primase/polymerase protein isoform X3 [Ananas comosus]|uniref:DNA-directed primase/polymerase protein n=1 Tax=Ananas comosus TaxID=4615 RepID=A0A6P5FQY3_ANACO|nr:DNA-directed primase/polymerase protein isoform X3 [Ananas comosus]
MAYDPKDDVDRLFACFKCGISPPQSALKERRTRDENLKKPAQPSTSKSYAMDSPATEKLGASTSAAIKFRSGKQITPIVFYGSPQGAPVKRPSRLLRLLHEIRIDLREQNELIRERVWATFPRQEEAMRFSKAHAQSKVFSYQDYLTGQRRFLVSTYDEFWGRYKNMDCKFRHHYEVIQDGSPCHLYFDLEFDKKVNNDKNVNEMVDTLISITFNALSDKYSIQGSQEWIIELDSSTREKFSRHLIVRIPKTAFKDNSHVGAFVSENEKQVFMDSLICKVDDDCDKLLICKLDLDCKKTLCFDSEVKEERSYVSFDAHRSDLCSHTYFSGKSPFPALDAFVECIGSVGNVSGKIRCWYWFSEYGLMVYSMSSGRYCERIGREHKSNHIMYIVDFQRAGYYQKCYDPDCRGYRSPLRPLPYDVIPDSMAIFNSTQTENYSEVVDINFAVQLDGDHNQLVIESCTKDYSWWEEAVKFADCMEVEDTSRMCNLVENNDEEDCEWWADAEKFASQVEGQV